MRYDSPDAHHFVGDMVVSGNVGIGVSDPDAKLEVAGTTHFQGAATFDSTISNVSTTHITASGNISSSGTVTLPTTLRFEGGSGGVRYGVHNLTNTKNEGSGHMLGFHIASGSDVGGAVINMSGSEGNAFIGIGTKYTAKMNHALTVEGSVSASATGSFGRIETTGDINTSGRIYEAGSSVIDHATAMAIVFGG